MTAASDPRAQSANRPPSWTVSALIATGLVVVLEETDSRLVVSLLPAWAGETNAPNASPTAPAECRQGRSVVLESEAGGYRVAKLRDA